MKIDNAIKNYIAPIKARIEIPRPRYYPYKEMSNETPVVYNSEGRVYDWFFLRDAHFAHAPYAPEHCSKYFIFDFFAYGLDIHFYSHREMLKTVGHPLKKYGCLFESKSIVPKDYEIFSKNRGLNKEFELIFTYDDRILNKVENARFVPFCAVPWYGNCSNSEADSEQFKKKEKDIFIVSSNKRMNHLHEVRLELATKCKREHLADAYGTFDGGKFISYDDVLGKYRYAIVIENDISDYFFTEKLTSCFMSQTIPIYLGARKIKEFFNIDGIIEIDEKSIENIEEVLKICNREYYETHIAYVLDNYERVQKYRNVMDFMYEQYLMM